MLSVFAVAVSLSTDPWAHVRPNSDLTVFASIDDSEEDASQKDALASISTGDVVPPLPSKRNRTVRMPLQSIRDNDSEESDKEDGDVSEEDAVDLLRQSGRQCRTDGASTNTCQPSRLGFSRECDIMGSYTHTCNRL
jgi:hypothetical protein